MRVNRKKRPCFVITNLLANKFTKNHSTLMVQTKGRHNSKSHIYTFHTSLTHLQVVGGHKAAKCGKKGQKNHGI